MADGIRGLQFTSQLSDPVWGALSITALEEEVLETRELSRLEHIKQMGLAFLDYPSLTHTRLEHSLGVMYVADRIFKTLRETTRNRIIGTTEKSQENIFTEEEVETLFSLHNQQAVRLAALLHDLGHPPFSHAVELTFLRYPDLLRMALQSLGESPEALDKERINLFESYSHETFTEWIINHSDSPLPDSDPDSEKSNLTDLDQKKPNTLRAILLREFSEEMVREIAALAVGHATGCLAPFNTIISGDFDADRIDYLIRDNRHSGFDIGLSLDELYNAVHLQRHSSDMAHRYEIYINRNALPFVNSVLSARERLINRVHLAPAGRAATQMLTRFLYEDLSAPSKGPKSLADTIIGLHRDCTDYTFFNQVRKRLPVRQEQSEESWRDIEHLIKWPSKRSVWRQYYHLGFTSMQPCLRLLAYICATARYKSPQELVFLSDKGKFIFLEPSSRPAPKFSLLVDYDCNPGTPSLDFIACTENRQGRAILAQSLSNLDVFAYDLEDQQDGQPVPYEGEVTPPGVNEYVEGLDDKGALLGRYVARLAHRVKKEHPTKGTGMLESEFLLAILYYLDKHIGKNFCEAREAYVYRSELFINYFLRSLIKEPLMPAAFRRSAEQLNSNRVFSEIQRLNVFGLIETRQRTIFHIPGSAKEERIRRTREGVYSTREDFRIDHWGKHYIEIEVRDQELLAKARDLVERRQNGVVSDLEEMALAYPGDPIGGVEDPPQLSRVSLLRQFYRDSRRIAENIHKKGGCAMIFRCK